MNRSVALVMLLTLTISFSKAQSVTRIDSLPDKGLALSTGWRWHAGNLPNGASPDLDASRWDTVPAYPTIDQLAGFRQQGVGWLHQTIQLDSAIAKLSLSIRVFNRRVTGLYVDGQLVHQFSTTDQQGHVNSIRFSPSGEYFLLPPLSAGVHTLALQALYIPDPWYVPRRIDHIGTVFSVRITQTDGLPALTAKKIYGDTLQNYWLLGFFLALAVIYLLYYSLRRRRIDLIFGLTMLLGVLNFLASEVPPYASSPQQEAWFIMISGLTLSLYFGALLFIYYLHLNQRPPWVYWLTMAVMLGNVFVASYSSYDFTDYVFPLSVTALLTLGMTLSVRAVKRNLKDGWIVLGSFVILIVVLTSQLILSIYLRTLLDTTFWTALEQFLGTLFFLTVPLTLALLLARENAQTNAQLAHNLAEVKQLSEDKEAILTQQKAFLEQQVAARTAELSQSLAELRATQQQLVQREKMASLGELTAGIAHEIQNPLNFVNNFSEVSTELVSELEEEQQKPTRDPELETELLSDLKQNLQKITHHGGRASSIVRGMLEHSRTSAGQKQASDLNALADEYLRLSYHGLRAKEKEFNAKLVTDFDPNLPLVPVVSQEIGRVLLNLFNNAFYAVQQRTTMGSTTYEPTVSVSTKAVARGIEIRVSDNGTGIPAGVLDKIFQPFFTTKPSGQGTGLGLSLSYDIVTKGHGGSFRVESVEGEGSTFVIELPAS